MIVDDSSSPNKRRGIQSRLAGSRLLWDYILGPSYNKRMIKIGRNFNRSFVDATMEGVEIPQQAKILDVGCGPGLFSSGVAEKYPGAEVTGTDYSPKQVDSARKVLAHHPLDNCDFKVGNAIDLPFEDGSFDIVVSTWSISCWPDMAKGLKEIRRVLVDGGKAVIVDADSSATEDEKRLFASAYAGSGVRKRLNELYTRRFVFGQSVAITSERAEALAVEAGFESIVSEKKEGLPFFVMKLIN